MKEDTRPKYRLNCDHISTVGGNTYGTAGDIVAFIKVVDGIIIYEDLYGERFSTAYYNLTQTGVNARLKKAHIPPKHYRRTN